MAIMFLLAGRFRWAISPLFQIKKWPGLLCGSFLISLPWGLLVWAPLNGETLAVAMGFFLGPLVLILVGLLVFREQLSFWQTMASITAGLAVAFSLWNTGQFSWIALVVAFSFSLYVVLRRVQPLPPLSAFFVESLLLVPAAIWACLIFGEVAHPFDYPPLLMAQLAGVAVIGATGMSLWLLASRRLPMSLLGLLGYLEPFLIFLAAVLIIKETIQAREWLTYILIGLAIILLSIDGLIHFSGKASDK